MEEMKKLSDRDKIQSQWAVLRENVNCQCSPPLLYDAAGNVCSDRVCRLQFLSPCPSAQQVPTEFGKPWIRSDNCFSTSRLNEKFEPPFFVSCADSTKLKATNSFSASDETHENEGGKKEETRDQRLFVRHAKNETHFILDPTGTWEELQLLVSKTSHPHKQEQEEKEKNTEDREEIKEAPFSSFTTTTTTTTTNKSKQNLKNEIKANKEAADSVTVRVEFFNFVRLSQLIQHEIKVPISQEKNLLNHVFNLSAFPLTMFAGGRLYLIAFMGNQSLNTAVEIKDPPPPLPPHRRIPTRSMIKIVIGFVVLAGTLGLLAGGHSLYSFYVTRRRLQEIRKWSMNAEQKKF